MNKQGKIIAICISEQKGTQKHEVEKANLIEDWNPLKPVERNVHSHAEAVEQIKAFLKQRGDWMDQNIHVLKQYSNESRNKAYIHE